MKNTMQILSHLVALLVLGAFFLFGPYAPVFDTWVLILYGVSALVSPLLGLCRLSVLSRVLLYILSVFSFSGGVFIAKELGGAALALIVLALGAVALGALFVSLSLPSETAETKQLRLRGLKETRIRKIVFLRQSYAFFFQKSGILAATCAAYHGLLFPPKTPAELFGLICLVVLISFLGQLIYLFLSAPTPCSLQATAKKSRLIVSSLLAFFLIIISVYVYVGSLYTAPDPALKSALAAVKAVLTPALLGTAVALIPGMLFGLFLSLFGARFFKTILSGIELFPAALLSGLLYFLLPASAPFPFVLSVSIPLVCMGACRALDSRINLLPYKNLPISDRKKALLRPLFHLPNLAQIPVILVSGVFSSLFLQLIGAETFYCLSSLSQTLAALILSVMLCILYMLCILTKEVRHVG